jgi:hypothetical protein
MYKIHTKYIVGNKNTSIYIVHLELYDNEIHVMTMGLCSWIYKPEIFYHISNPGDMAKTNSYIKYLYKYATRNELFIKYKIKKISKTNNNMERDSARYHLSLK